MLLWNLKQISVDRQTQNRNIIILYPKLIIEFIKIILYFPTPKIEKIFFLIVSL